MSKGERRGSREENRQRVVGVEGGKEMAPVMVAQGVEEERREGEVFQLDGANSDPEFILSISARWSGKELDAALGSPFAILTPRNSPLLRRADPRGNAPRLFLRPVPTTIFAHNFKKNTLKNMFLLIKFHFFLILRLIMF